MQSGLRASSWGTPRANPCARKLASTQPVPLPEPWHLLPSGSHLACLAWGSSPMTPSHPQHLVLGWTVSCVNSSHLGPSEELPVFQAVLRKGVIGDTSSGNKKDKLSCPENEASEPLRTRMPTGLQSYDINCTPAALGPLNSLDGTPMSRWTRDTVWVVFLQLHNEVILPRPQGARLSKVTHAHLWDGVGWGKRQVSS